MSTATTGTGRALPPVVRRAREVLASVLAWAAAVLLVLMTLLVLYQVFTRYVLNDPADFTEELVRYCLIWTGFIAAAYAFATRRHMALVIVRDRMPKGGRTALLVFTDVLILVFALLVITIGGVQLAYGARHELSALLGIPRSIVYGVAPIAGALIVLVQIVNIWEDVVDPKAAAGPGEDTDVIEDARADGPDDIGASDGARTSSADPGGTSSADPGRISRTDPGRTS